MGSKRKRSAQDAAVAAPAAKKQQKTSKPTTKKPVETPVPLDTSPFVNNPRGDDLKREVSLYDMLSSEDDSQRLDAANAIVSGLLGGDGVEESTLQKHLERRLFRGLASGRKGARLGFSIVLSELLAQLFGSANLSATKYPGLTFDNVFEFLILKTKPEGDLSGQEQKDHALGLLFGLQCFVRSKILFSIDGKWELVLDKLLDLSSKKSWTREECGWVIMEALEQMNQDQAESTLKKLCDVGLGLSPEGVVSENEVSKQSLGQSGNPLEHLNSLAKALKESSSSEETSSKGQQAKQTGTWNAKLHFVWDIVLSQYVKAANNKAKNVMSEFDKFWKVTVDENLFSASASRERKFWASCIFSHNLVRCLINHVQEKDRFLNRAADKSLKVLTHAVEENPEALVVVLQGLIDGNGAYSFDRVTKTKTIEKLLSMVDDTNGEAVLDVLTSPVLVVPSSETNDAEKRRQMFGDYVLTTIRHVDLTEASQNSSWIKTAALPQLASLAYSNNSEAKPPISEGTRTLIRNRLTSAFTHLLSNMDGYHYPCDLVISCTPDAVAMDGLITGAKDAAFTTLQKLMKKAKKGGKDKATFQTLSLLYALVIFQLYNGDVEAVSILDELKLCYDNLIKHKSIEDSEVAPFEVLVELLLSFLSRPSALLRKVTQHVFTAFMGEMTEGGLKLMTDVLETSENMRGQQEMFDENPDDEDAMDVDEEDDEMDSDVEVVDMNGEEGHLNAHLAEEEEESDEEDSEEESEDDGDEGDDEANKELNDALAKILGTSSLDQNEEDEDGDSDSDMTDSGMDALTPKLEEVLGRMQKKGPSKKQEQKDAKENMVNFKSRVLDLLDIYAKKQASDPLAAEILLPLLRLIRSTKAKHLSDKAFSIIQAFAKSKSKASSSEAEVEINVKAQIALIKGFHEEVLKDQSKVFAKAASIASLSLASGIYRADKSQFEKIGKVYLQTMTKCDVEGVKIQASFVSDWVNWWQSHIAQATAGSAAKEE
ncbi:DNA polymerase v [Botrytis cinerea]